MFSMFRKLLIIFTLCFCFSGIIHASSNGTNQEDYDETIIQNGRVANSKGILGEIIEIAKKNINDKANRIYTLGRGIKRMLVGGKPIDEQKLTSYADYLFKNFFSYIESDLNKSIEDNAKTLGKMANAAGIIFSTIMLIYIMFLGLRYLFFAQLDVSIYDLLIQNVKWAIIICLFFSIPLVTGLYKYIVNIDHILTHTFFGTNFGSSTMDTLAVRSFKVIIPIYNQYATAGLLTAPFSLFGSIKLLYAFSTVIVVFLVSAFASYMAAKVMFSIVLIFMPIAAGFLLFEETKNYFASYITLLSQLLIGMMFVVFLTDMFCNILSHLLDTYYNKNILIDGLEGLSPDLKATAQTMGDLAASITSGYLEQKVLLMKVAALSGVYLTFLITVPIVVKNMFKGSLRSRKIG